MQKPLLTALLITILGSSEALAIVGMPLTPMSYAGVARRTTRRAVYTGAAVTAGAAAAAATVPALPPGCAPGVPCNGTTYQPAYSGTTVVYVGQ